MKKEFYETEFGKDTKARLTRIFIIGIACVIYSIYLTIDAIIIDAAVYQYVMAGLTFIAGLVFIIGKFKLENKFIKDYSSKKKK